MHTHPEKDREVEMMGRGKERKDGVKLLRKELLKTSRQM